jgi:hypothetical protein
LLKTPVNIKSCIIKEVRATITKSFGRPDLSVVLVVIGGVGWGGVGGGEGKTGGEKKQQAGR